MQITLPITLHNPKLAITLHDLQYVLLKTWPYAWPLAFPSGVVVIKYCANHKGIMTVLSTVFGRIRQYVRQLVRPNKHEGYDIYQGSSQEEEYWRSSERLRQSLQPSNASNIPPDIPLVGYYVPKLLPLYREKEEEDPEATDFHLPSKAFCKWHRMVIPGPLHPTVKEAEEQIKYYSSRDRREILRISRFVSDKDMFHRKVRWTPRYSTMWKDWLNKKGPDVAIVFE